MTDLGYVLAALFGALGLVGAAGVGAWLSRRRRGDPHQQGDLASRVTLRDGQLTAEAAGGGANFHIAPNPSPAVTDTGRFAAVMQSDPMLVRIDQHVSEVRALVEGCARRSDVDHLAARLTSAEQAIGKLREELAVERGRAEERRTAAAFGSRSPRAPHDGS